MSGCFVVPLVDATTFETVDLEAIRRLCSVGLSECAAVDRCVAWLVMLGIFPKKTAEWEEKKRTLSVMYKDYVTIAKLEGWEEKYIKETLGRSERPPGDEKVMHLIHADIHRTKRNIAFFPPEAPADGVPDGFEAVMCRHMRRLERLLYVFATMNSTLGYLQGFNELASVLYHVNVHAMEYLGDMDTVEAITFHCFQALIGKTRIHEFYTVHDGPDIVMFHMRRFSSLMLVHLPEVQGRIDQLGIEPLEYAFRWFNVLFAHEHQLPTLLIIWDSLLAHIDDLMDFVFCVAMAHVQEVQDEIDWTDFSTAVQKLQRPVAYNIFVTLANAVEMYRIEKDPTPLDNLRKAFSSMGRSLKVK